MQIQENISFRRYNTFGIDAKARYFSVFKDIDELEELIGQGTRIKIQGTRLVLGGGSNILFTKDYDGLVLKNEITGIDELHEDNEYVYVKAGAGENWHQFVLYCISRNWAGVENLSLIPGNVGASPMQNIGAYGVELQEVFYSLEAFSLQEKKVFSFSRNDCEFGYRNSIFKERYKDQFVITSVIFRLKKKPGFHTNYGAINEELEKMGVKELSIQAISQAVINIRSSKLPDPKEIGNAGSFFKNPSVSKDRFEELKTKFPAIVGYNNSDGTIKLAAGWLIEQCGWKGYRSGDAGCHAKQALVLVNYGNATGQQVYDLSEKILSSVQEKFGVRLEREVNII
ncbi:MAG: UDP-N-acetylmuramate dehydrogenase [Chitinophagaceae bacterium]|nr:UDP-N-acetylmuramate dehydrogenase [Chitinophagaceae bacterium]